MKILITGGSGMLGQAIIHDPLFAKDEFVVLTRRHGNYQLTERVNYQSWNPFVLDGWQDALQGIDVVLNLAGENIGSGLWTKSKKEKILMSRVSAGRSLEKAMLAMDNPPQVFIQSSAVGYYGSRGNEALAENASNGEGFLAHVCKKWEESSQELKTIDVRRIVLRTGVVLSKKSGLLPRMSLPIKLYIGGNLGSGKQYIPWLHIDDYTAMVHFLIHNENASGVFNLCAQALPLSVVGKKMAEVYQRPYWLPVPDFAMKLLLGEMSSLVLNSQRVVPEKLAAMGYQYRYATIEEVLKSFV
jgi:uncharacterized protein